MNPIVQNIINKRNVNIELNNDNLHSPFLFLNMENAVNIIQNAISSNERILIYGDYDVDGIVSTDCLYRHIKSMGGDVLRFIPHRINEGYGINSKIIPQLIAANIKLVITCDNGIAAIDAISEITQQGIKVIVSDHHEPGQSIPSCDAIIDAKCVGERYPFKHLCGAGVAFKIIEALSGREAAFDYIEEVALATVADVVPLVDENRLLVQEGLKKMNSNPSPWVSVLKKISTISGEMRSRHLAFNLAPLLNSCGRISTAKVGAQFLDERDPERLYSLAKQMMALNDERKKIEKEIFDSIKIPHEEKIVIAFGEYHEGVIGVVAARIVEKTNKPCIVFSYNKEKHEYKGSGRSIDGVDLYSLISKCSEFITQFGGHKQAAGVTVPEDKFNNFCYKIKSIADFLPEDVFKKKINFESEISLSEISLDFLNELSILEPFGCENENPIFMIKDAEIHNPRIIGAEGNSYICSLLNGTQEVSAVAYRQSVPSDGPATILCNVEEYNGKPICRIVKAEKNAIDYSKIIDTTVFSTRTIPLSLESLGISEKKAAQFYQAGINNCDDLLRYFPRDYLDFRHPILSEAIANKEKCSIVGTVLRVNTKKAANNMPMVTCACKDDNGHSFFAIWFNQTYVARLLITGQKYIFCGTGFVNDSGIKSVNVLFFDRNIEKLKAIIPVYKKIKGMSADFLNDSISKALITIPNTDYLEKSIVEKFELVPSKQSILSLHRPQNEYDIEQAQNRQVFDELFKFNLILKKKAIEKKNEEIPRVASAEIINSFKKCIPYELTNDQEDTIQKISTAFINHEHVNALIQGDVGCGKSIIAFMLAAVIASNGLQSCIIAPTEVLAAQHYKELTGYAEKLGVTVSFLSGSTKVRERKKILNELESGNINILVGTHAVLNESVKFNSLGLVVIDEQHKFGADQRGALIKSNNPHVVTMSATPIPRTLAMATFGDDIQVYNINSKPAGRKSIITIKSSSDDESYNYILAEVKKGHQAYIVCPAIDPSEKMENMISVSKTIENVKKFFAPWPEIHISGITGRMKNEDIRAEIDKFKNNELQILISTTIIEVGVNVPNASIIVIKNSDRFGLAQAHQLRGRVGRGDVQSYCILQPENEEDNKARIMCSTNDGFEIAKADLAIRGTGDFIGTSQSGYNKCTSLMINAPILYKKISEENEKIISSNRYELYKFLIDDSGDVCTN